MFLSSKPSKHYRLPSTLSKLILGASYNCITALYSQMKAADEQKKRQLDEFSGRGAVHQDTKHLDVSEQALKERHKQADILKQKTLDSYDKAAGKNISQTSTVSTDVSRGRVMVAPMVAS